MKQKIDNDKMWESLIRNSIGTDLYVQLKKSFKEQGLQYNPETKEIESINDDVFLKKDNWYICIKDVYMNGKKDLRAYTKGSLYKCLADDTLPDDFGNDGHYWGEDGQQEKYFRPATEEEMPPSKRKQVEAVVNESVEQKPTWSEEEERHLQCAIQYTYANGFLSTADWLKSLKDKVLPKQKWSEEDEDAIGMAIIALDDMYNPDEPNNTYAGHSMPFDKAAERLKSLRERYAWKPSDEQIEALEHFVRSIGESGYASPYDNNTKLVYLLLSELKKLREE